MINSQKLGLVLQAYKENFHKPDPVKGNKSGWEAEQYKWIAVKQFQDNWNIDAPDFIQMFKVATSKTGNLLEAKNFFPKMMILKLAEVDEKAVRDMFRKLYDEQLLLADRVDQFIFEADIILKKYDAKMSHYQNLCAVSTYLWLKYPEKYYIYKYSECKEVAKVLESDYRSERTSKGNNLPAFIKFYDEIATAIASNQDIVNMIRAALTDKCYADQNFRTLTIDVGYFISRYYMKTNNKETIDTIVSEGNLIDYAWFVGASDNGNGNDYTDQWIAEGKWENLWSDGTFSDRVNAVEVGDKIVIKAAYTKKNVPFNANGKTISVLGIKAIGTVTQNSGNGKSLSVQWEKVEPRKEWYDSCSIRETIRLVRASDGENQAALLRFVFNDEKQDYTRIEDKYKQSVYWPAEEDYRVSITKEEWKKYIEEVEMPNHKGCVAMLKAILEQGGEASCKKLSLIYGGNPSRYVGSAVNIGRRAKKYFSLPACMDGDVERYFAITFWGRTVIEDGTEYYSYKLRDELREALEELDLSDIDPYLGDEEEEKKTDEKIIPKLNKRGTQKWELNQIFYGAPGTGKTYSTIEYAVAIAEKRQINLNKLSDEERNALKEKFDAFVAAGNITFTTFHQNYGYEDFIQGIRPDLQSESVAFRKNDGVFKVIAEKALLDPENNYVIIIDEINRANISKVFGELITLIEDDKRWGEDNQLSVVLPMGERFVVPNNLFIIGTMNSADKSISLLDTALRRRFSFVEMPPHEEYVEDVVLRGVMSRLNEHLKKELRSTDMLIGHAYFIGKNESNLDSIMNNKIIPLLYEYFYDDENKVETTLKNALEGTKFETVLNVIGRLRIRKKSAND